MGSKLRGRIECLLSAVDDPIRHTEIDTFRRILFRNRNQHRHGPYFRKLEHVRRVLWKIERHFSWDSLKIAVGESPKATRSKKNQHVPLAISTMTLDDLKSVTQLYEELVHVIIPKAAVSITVELICREHFLRVSIPVVATLARLYVMEKHMLYQLRRLVLEISIWFGYDENLEATEGKAVNDAFEDVGSPLLEHKLKEQQQNRGNDNPNLRRSTTGSDQNMQCETRKDPDSHGKNGQLGDVCTLYDVLEKSNLKEDLKDVVMKHTFVALPDVLQGNANNGREFSPKMDKPLPDPESSEDHPTIENKPRNEEVEVHRSHHQQSTCEPLKKKVRVEEEFAESSDSEDIDDIFDALET